MDTSGLLYRIVIIERQLSALWINMSDALSKIDILERKIDEIQSALGQEDNRAHYSF